MSMKKSATSERKAEGYLETLKDIVAGVTAEKQPPMKTHQTLTAVIVEEIDFTR